MNALHGAVRLDRTTGSTRPVSSFLERSWRALRGEVDHVALNRLIDPRVIGSSHGGTFLAALLCAACIVLWAREASAQCMARDVLQNHLTLKKAPSADRLPILVRSALFARRFGTTWRRSI
jgi:hypothetical protein